ncbi:MAG TPA: hypothetical protein VIN58_20625, partial [Roseateles sp.]
SATDRGVVALRTLANSLSVNTRGIGDVGIAQGARRLTVTGSEINDGSVTLTAGGLVDLARLVVKSNRAGADISVTAQGSILVREVSAGLFLTDLQDAPEVHGTGNVLLALPGYSSAGNVSLTSTTGSITENFVDAAPDLVANVLTLRAATGITGLEIAANKLNAETTGGDIQLDDFDGLKETSPGLDVVRAVTATGLSSATTVSLGTTGQNPGQASRTGIQGDLRVVEDGWVRGDTIRLASTTDSVYVIDPVAAGRSGTPQQQMTSLHFTRGIAFDAAHTVQLYTFFSGPELTEYRAGDYFSFADAGDNRRLLPSSISSDTIILESGSTLSLTGTLSASKRLELVSKQDVILSGVVSARGGGSIEELVIVASGVTDSIKSIDIDQDGHFTSQFVETGPDADNDGIDDVKHARILGIDFDGVLGLTNDLIVESEVATPTGHIDLKLSDLPVAHMELRAARDIRLQVTNSLNVAGFVGGLAGFDPAANVRITTDGALQLRGGIVGAQQDLVVRAATIASDSASVFIAGSLDVETTGSVAASATAIQLNTFVSQLRAVSKGTGGISVKEAGKILIQDVEAQDGAIFIESGGDVDVRLVLNYADGDDITIKAGGDLAIDRVESGSAAGAHKTGGTITVDARGSITELEALGYTADGRPDGTSAFDDRAAELYGWKVVVRHSPPSAVHITQLVTGSDQGNGDDIEVRTVAGLTTGVSQLSEAGAASEGTGIVNLTPTTTPAGENTRQVSEISFAGSLLKDDIYVVTVNGQRYSAKLAGSGAGANGTPTVTEFTTALNSLKTQIQTQGFSVDINAGLGMLTITGSADNVAFTVSAAVREDVYTPYGLAVVSDGSVPTTPHDTLVAQVSRVGFASTAPSVGDLVSVAVDGNSYTVKVASGATTWTDVLGALRDLVNADGPLAVTASVDTGAMQLVLTADAVDAPFTVSNVQALHETTDDGSTPLTPAGVSQAQVSQLRIDTGIGLDSFKTFTVTVGGTPYTVKVGDSAGGVTVAANNYASLTKELAAQIDALSTVDAAERVIDGSAISNPDGRTYTLVIGSDTYHYTGAAGDDANTVIRELARKINATHALSAMAQGTTLLLLDKTVATAATPITHGWDGSGADGLTLDPADGIVWLVGATDNQAFTFGSFSVTDTPTYSTTVNGTGGAAQKSVVNFSTSPLPGTTYRIDVGGRTYQWTTDADPTQAEMINAFKAAILADGSNGANAVVTAATVGSTVELTAKAVDTPFAVNIVAASLSARDDTPTISTHQSADSSHAQQTDVSFSATPLALTTYAFTIAGRSYSFTTDATPTASEARQALFDLIDNDTAATVSVQLISNGVRITAGAVGTASAFAVEADPAFRVAADVEVVAAGVDAKQVSRVIFADNTLVAGDKVTLNVGGTTYSAIVASGGTDWNTVLNQLKTAIHDDTQLAVEITAIDATARSITLTADAFNAGFSVDTVQVLHAHEIDSTVATVAAPVNRVTVQTPVAQHSVLAFGGALADDTVITVAADTIYEVTVGHGGVTNSWTSVIGELVRQINLGSAVHASATGVSSLDLLATHTNTPFSVGATVRQGDAYSNLSYTDDGVVIIPARTVAGDMRISAGGDLFIVRLPVDRTLNPKIDLTAGGSVVLVDEFDLGTTGTLTVTAADSITLGDLVTAGTLTASAHNDLSVKTKVSDMKITLQGHGSDFTVDQTGALHIRTLDMDGGNITIRATGAVTIDSITGSVGDIDIVTTSGDIIIGGSALTTAT